MADLGNYSWMLEEASPKMVAEALKLYGVTEFVGDKNNPEIIKWAKELGLRGYTSDSIPWCGLFVAIVAKRAGKSLPARPLWARNWATWGTRAPRPSFGDVLVFSRDGGGHVGLYVCEDDECYHVLGGNQKDAVNIVRISKSRCIAARHMYKVGPPPSAHARLCHGHAEVSTNES